MPHATGVQSGTHTETYPEKTGKCSNFPFRIRVRQRPRAPAPDPGASGIRPQPLSWTGMNWLTNYVLPKIRVVRRKEVPDNLWHKCPSCEQMLFHRDCAETLEVSRSCGHHCRIGSQARFKMLFDGGEFAAVEPPKVAPDPLRFR